MGVRPIRSIRVPTGVPAGVLATIIMDVAMVAASSLGGRAFTSDRLGPEMIGRWAAGLLRGRWRRSDISREPAQRGELALGAWPPTTSRASRSRRHSCWCRVAGVGDGASWQGPCTASRRPSCRS